jgi:hypothetical protein
MELAHGRHGNGDAHTAGKLVGHGRYEVFAAVFFGGRRRRVFRAAGRRERRPPR